jgi:hypothetical protein
MGWHRFYSGVLVVVLLMAYKEDLLKNRNIEFTKYMDRIYVGGSTLSKEDVEFLVELGFTYSKRNSGYVEDI